MPKTRGDRGEKQKNITLHLRTKENHLVSQIQRALWRKLQPLINKKLYVQKRSKKILSYQRANPADQKKKPQQIDMCAMTSQCETRC